MIWLVQNALFGEEMEYERFIAAIDHTGDRRIKLDYVFWESTIDLKLTGVTDLKSIIPFGTRSFVAYAIKNGWRVFWDQDYDYAALRCLGEDFINHDLQVGPMDELEVPYDGKIYMREAAGFNIIKGKVISAYSWPDWKNGFKRNLEGDVSPHHHDWHPIDGTTPFVVAPVKKIINEYRVWVVARKVISSSRYVENGVVKYSNSDDNFVVNSYAQKMVDKLPFKMDNFVIDIFETDKGLRVGELNCLHCSGWYAIDSVKVVEALSEDYLSKGRRDSDLQEV